MVALQETVLLELAAHRVVLVLLPRQALWHGLQAMPHCVSGFSYCLCIDESRSHLSLRAPHGCAMRSQPVSHVFAVAATREPSLAEGLSQLSRSLPVCCKVTASRSSRMPFVSSGLGAAAASDASGAGMGCSALPISSSTGATTACGVGTLVSGMIQASVFWIERPEVLIFFGMSTRCTPVSVSRSIHEFLYPILTSAPLCVSFPTLRRSL